MGTTASKRKGAERLSRQESAGPAANAGVHPARFAVIFTICAAGAFGLMLAPFAKPVVSRFSDTLVVVSAQFIRIAGGHVAVDGSVMRSPQTGFAIEMKNGCNGVNVMVLLWSAMLAFPTSGSWKAKGIIVGALAIQSINFVRFISLFYLGQFSMQWFEFAHSYLWESLIMLDALAVFWFWAQLIHRSVSTANATG